MNKCILVGRLTKDPELSTTSSGTSVCKFTLAVSRGYKNANGDVDADFFNIIVWREKGENAARFLKKGKLAGISGALQTRSYEGNDGVKRYVTEIIADEVEFLSPKTEDSGTPESPKKKPAKTVDELEPVTDDDLPF